jgi:hypothetical protein
VGQSVVGRRPMYQDLDHKMVDKDLVDRLAMDFLVHSWTEVAYSQTEPVAEAVVCEVVVVVRPSSEAVDPSVGVVDHNCRMVVDILPKV